MRILRPAVLLATLTGCPDHDPQPFDEPALETCLYAPEWIGRSCDEICQDVDPAGGYYELVCASGPRCEDTIGIGYTRLDACFKREYGQPLSQSCTEPLPESLAESVYFVSCCCVEAP